MRPLANSRGDGLESGDALVTSDALLRLFDVAWEYRENSFLVGQTKVGAAALAGNGSVYPGCNVEHQFRSHDIHAEVAAIASMVTAGQTELVAIAVVGHVERISPCGSCLDWIMQFGGPDCVVAWQSLGGSEYSCETALALMPFYPKSR